MIQWHHGSRGLVRGTQYNLCKIQATRINEGKITKVEKALHLKSETLGLNFIFVFNQQCGLINLLGLLLFYIHFLANGPVAT